MTTTPHAAASCIGRTAPARVERMFQQSRETSFMRTVQQAPLTMALIAVCCVLAYFAPLAAPTPLTLDLLFPDFSYGTRTIVLSRVIDSFGFSELARMLTPILLHGGVLHLLFN